MSNEDVAIGHIADIIMREANAKFSFSSSWPKFFRKLDVKPPIEFEIIWYLGSNHREVDTHYFQQILSNYFHKGELTNFGLMIEQFLEWYWPTISPKFIEKINNRLNDLCLVLIKIGEGRFHINNQKNEVITQLKRQVGEIEKVVEKNKKEIK